MSPTRGRREGGFSFIEILVVMGIIAVLVGIGVGVYQIVAKKTPQVKTSALLQKMRASTDAWRGRFKAQPPAVLDRLPVVAGLPLKPGKPVPPNQTNAGIESLYQCLQIPGFEGNPQLTDEELCNTDDDKLDKALSPNVAPDLFEVKDAWEHPLVYFPESEYATAEKSPPTYINGDGSAVNPKPWRTAAGTFAQPTSYQVFSMGPDGLPNTDDDLVAWENR